MGVRTTMQLYAMDNKHTHVILAHTKASGRLRFSSVCADFDDNGRVRLHIGAAGDFPVIFKQCSIVYSNDIAQNVKEFLN